MDKKLSQGVVHRGCKCACESSHTIPYYPLKLPDMVTAPPFTPIPYPSTVPGATPQLHPTTLDITLTSLVDFSDLVLAGFLPTFSWRGLLHEGLMTFRADAILVPLSEIAPGPECQHYRVGGDIVRGKQIVSRR